MDQIASNIGLLIDFPVVNLKIIIDGVMIGALFALAAYGLALVWGVMNVKNLAQGDFVIGGGYVSWWLVKNVGLHPLLGVPVAFVVMALLGGALHGTAIHNWARSQSKAMIWISALTFIVFVVATYMGEAAGSVAGYAGLVLTILLIINGGIYNLVISRVIERDLFTSLLATFGLAIMGAQIMNLLFGSDTQSLDLGYDTLYFADGLIDVPIAKLIGVIMAATLAAAVILFMKLSRMGQAIRATASPLRAGAW